MLDKDDVELYADSAYRSQNIEHYLQDIKCKSPIHEKAVRSNPLSDQQKANNNKKLGKQNNKVLHRVYRDTPLTNKQKQENKQHSSIRYVIERTFGLLKLHHELAKARYLGLERNKTRVQLIAVSHNLKTGMNIFKQMQSLMDCYVQ